MKNHKKNIFYFIFLTLLVACLIFRNSLFLGSLLILCRPLFLLLLVYYFFRKKEYKLWSILFFSLLICEYSFVKIQNYRQDNLKHKQNKELKILNHNLLYISEPNKIQLDSILSLKPDLILLQELNPKWDTYLHKKLRKKYPYKYTHAQKNTYGLGVFSKIPIDKIEYFEEYKGIPFCQKVSFRLGQKRFQIYNTHYDSPAIAFYGEGSFLELLESSHIRRKKEYASIIEDNLKSAREIAILCGDLNTLPIEPLYREFKNSWLDAGSVRKNSSLSFRTKKCGPILSLDHVFYKGEIECVYSEVQTFGNSDHLPVFSVFNY